MELWVENVSLPSYHSANLGWFRRLHQTSAVWQDLISVSALHLWYDCRRFTASDKHNALVVLWILKGYEAYTRFPCIYSLNLINYHISYYCISIILVHLVFTQLHLFWKWSQFNGALRDTAEVRWATNRPRWAEWPSYMYQTKISAQWICFAFSKQGFFFF
jgi:hypothetical protein